MRFSLVPSISIFTGPAPRDHGAQGLAAVAAATGRPQIFRGYQWVGARSKASFLLASIACFRYPIVCLASERPPAVI
jgi:hypothetical protein